jgi:2'-5' RNA ligase
MRVFIGIFPPEHIKEKILELQKKIKVLPIVAKMVEKENLHISVSFLGDITEDEVNVISYKLDQIVKGYEKFEVKIDKIKLIPNEKYIRVIALDVLSPEINNLMKDIKTNIGGDVKPPHITLCRVKKISDKNIVIKKLSELFLKESFTVDNVSLVKSVLTRSGPKYYILHESHLKQEK